MKTKRMATDSILAAICTVLALLAIDTGTMKITFESLPVLLGAILFGPFDGAIIGALGTFLYQILKFGITATTVLWILPYVACGLIVGYYSKMHKFSLSKNQLLFIILIAELTITGFNTLALYVDSKIYGYYTPTIISAMIFWRLGIAIAKSFAFTFVLPPVIKVGNKFGK